MIKYIDPAPNGIALEKYADGSVKQGYLDGSVKIGGVKYCTGIAFWPGGKVRVGRIDGTAKIKGIISSGYIYFYPSGKLMSCKPEDYSEIKGIHFKKGQYIDFSESGEVIAGCSSGKQIIKGKKIPEDSFFKIDTSRKAAAVNIEGMTGNWSSLIDGMNYECSITSREFACGGYSGGGRFSEWGTSCTFREFLQGDLQDFPLCYLPDDYAEIIHLADRIHKMISSVEIYKFSFIKTESDGNFEKGKHLKNFSWCEGYDAEYEYSVDVYERYIVWHLQFDEQWIDPPKDAVQRIEDFIRDGPPTDFSSSSNCMGIITYVKSLKLQD